ncbi:chemotaxis protein CheW [Ferdinandcohnia sp. Marseille-Q9671]
MENEKVVVFSTGNEEFGIPVLHVISIEKSQQLNTIPHMPSYMQGVLTIRDELVPIVDTGILLFSKKIEPTEKTRIIVTKTDSLSVGLLVDDAKEILDIPHSQLKQLNLTYQLSPYISGVATLNDRLITLLDPFKLFEDIEGFEVIKEHIHSHQE